MRRLTLFGVIISAAITLFTGCNPDEAPMPKLTSTTEENISVPAGESKAVITYDLENPAENGDLKATANPEDWIGDFDYSKDGEIAFKVAANDAQEEREATIVVTYTYSDKQQSFGVKVTQAAKGADPVLTLTSDAEIAAGNEGGKFEITFTLDNPVEGGELTAESDEWITSTVNASSIDITVAANEDEAEREGKITATYTWDGEPLSFEVIVKQKGAPKSYTDAFNIEVPEEYLTATSATVISSCNYSELYWTSQIMSQEQLDTYCNGDKEQMKDYFITLLEATAEKSGLPMDIFLPLFLFAGDKEDEFIYSVTPETHFLTFAVGMDYDMNYTTDFYWGPEFTTPADTGGDEPGELTFEIEVVPKTTSAIMSVYPSDKSAKYIATALDESFFTSGLTDEDVMNEVVSQLGFLIIFMLDQGDVIDAEVTGMMPESNYYAVAFGVDSETYTYNSALTKVPFTTLPSEETDAYATGDITNYWDINDLQEYKAEYADLMRDAAKPILAAVDIDFNESATGCYYALWVGDLSANDYDEMYDQTLMAQKTLQAGDPAPLFYMAYDQVGTVTVIATDADNNFGDMSVKVVTVTKDGASDDFALFDDYYNDTMGSSAKAMGIEPFNEPSKLVYRENKEREALVYDFKTSRANTWVVREK